MEEQVSPKISVKKCQKMDEEEVPSLDQINQSAKFEDSHVLHEMQSSYNSFIIKQKDPNFKYDGPSL